MSLAMKYGMMKRAKRCAHGGDADCPQCYAEGGEVGVHKPAYEGEKGKELGHSDTGNDVRSMRYKNRSPHDPAAAAARAKEKHHKVLGELRGMKKPNLYAEGGMVEDDDDDMVGRILRDHSSEPVADFEQDDFDYVDEMPQEHEADYTGENSGDDVGDKAEDEDEKDIVSRAMKSFKKKDRMPRPA